MLYSTVSSGPAALAWILWFFIWIGGMIWAYTAAEEHNCRTTPPRRDASASI